MREIVHTVIDDTRAPYRANHIGSIGHGRNHDWRGQSKPVQRTANRPNDRLPIQVLDNPQAGIGQHGGLENRYFALPALWLRQPRQHSPQFAIGFPRIREGQSRVAHSNSVDPDHRKVFCDSFKKVLTARWVLAPIVREDDERRLPLTVYGTSVSHAFALRKADSVSLPRVHFIIRTAVRGNLLAIDEFRVKCPVALRHDLRRPVLLDGALSCCGQPAPQGLVPRDLLQRPAQFRHAVRYEKQARSPVSDQVTAPGNVGRDGRHASRHGLHQAAWNALLRQRGMPSSRDGRTKASNPLRKAILSSRKPKKRT